MIAIICEGHSVLQRYQDFSNHDYVTKRAMKQQANVM